MAISSGDRNQMVVYVKEYLKSQHMPVVEDWLQGCVQFFQEQRAGRSYSTQELNTMARGQWLLGDLTEICPGCLPKDLNKTIKTQLTGIYILQMNRVLDIGIAAFQQLQKLNKVDTTNIEATVENNQSQFPEPSSQRLLKLWLTDGVQEICGMEYKPMRNLSVDLLPGIKLQIKGPVDCRRGMLMLEEKHVTVLGGEVDSLMEANRYRNVLSRIVESNSGENGNRSAPVDIFTRESIPQNIQQPSRNNRNTNNTTNQSNHGRRNDGQVTEQGFDNIDENELINIDADLFSEDFNVDMIDEIENAALAPSSSHQATPQAIVKKMKLNKMDHFVVKKLSPKRNDNIDRDEDEDFLRMIEMEEKSVDLKESSLEYPIKVSVKPFVYLKQLSEMSEDVLLNKKYLVKAQVISIINKLKFKNGDWDLKCKICDGTSYLDVDVAGEVLSSLVGYSSAEMSRMKNQMVSNPQLKQQVVKGLSEAHRKLQTMDSLLEVLYKPSGPCIMRIVEYTDDHLRLLSQRT